jgi:hypothetical protein
MAEPVRLDAWYVTDEDIAALADGDFQVVAPRDVAAAYGTDGVIAAGSWSLVSNTVDFEAQGVAANMIIQLLDGSAGIKGSGILMAVESVAGHSVTMRRIGQAVGWGQPPVRQGASAVEFVVATLGNLMESVAFALHQRYGLDPKFVTRAPSNVYDLRVFRNVTVYETLRRRYVSLNRTKAGDFADKIKHYADEVNKELATITVRWGPDGMSQTPTTGDQVRLAR